MEIQGPFKIEYSEDANQGIRELHFTFTGLFRALGLEQRIATFEAYIEQLINDVNKTEDLNKRQGIITILQISEQLLPHLKANEIPLNETIVVEMGERTEGTSLTELLNNTKPN